MAAVDENRGGDDGRVVFACVPGERREVQRDIIMSVRTWAHKVMGESKVGLAFGNNLRGSILREVYSRSGGWCVYGEGGRHGSGAGTKVSRFRHKFRQCR